MKKIIFFCAFFSMSLCGMEKKSTAINTLLASAKSRTHPIEKVIMQWQQTLPITEYTRKLQSASQYYKIQIAALKKGNKIYDHDIQKSINELIRQQNVVIQSLLAINTITQPATDNLEVS